MDLVMLGAIGDFCQEMAGILKFVGYVLWIFKLVIPIMIFVYGIIDLGKAATASKDDEIKKALKQLAIRIAAGVLIFFIPTVIMFIFKFITEFNDVMSETQFTYCETCILNPSQCNTTQVD